MGLELVSGEGAVTFQELAERGTFRSRRSTGYNIAEAVWQNGENWAGSICIALDVLAKLTSSSEIKGKAYDAMEYVYGAFALREATAKLSLVLEFEHMRKIPVFVSLASRVVYVVQAVLFFFAKVSPTWFKRSNALLNLATVVQMGKMGVDNVMQFSKLLTVQFESKDTPGSLPESAKEAVEGKKREKLANIAVSLTVLTYSLFNTFNPLVRFGVGKSPRSIQVITPLMTIAGIAAQYFMNERITYESELQRDGFSIIYK